MSVNTDGGVRDRLAKELFAPSIRNFRKRKVITRYIDKLWATDLHDLRKYVDENWFTGRGCARTTYKYLLVVIDTFSKYLFQEPLANKHGKTASTLERILKNSKWCPKLLHSDLGREFINK